MNDSNDRQALNETTSNNHASREMSVNRLSQDNNNESKSTNEQIADNDEIIVVRVRAEQNSEIRARVNYHRVAQRNALRRINRKLGAK